MESIPVDKGSATPHSVSGMAFAKQASPLEALGLDSLPIALLVVIIFLGSPVHAGHAMHGVAFQYPLQVERHDYVKDDTTSDLVTACLVDAPAEIDTYEKATVRRRSRTGDFQLFKLKRHAPPYNPLNWSQHVIRSASYAADVLALSLKDCDDDLTEEPE